MEVSSNANGFYGNANVIAFVDTYEVLAVMELVEFR